MGKRGDYTADLQTRFPSTNQSTLHSASSKICKAILHRNSTHDVTGSWTNEVDKILVL